MESPFSAAGNWSGLQVGGAPYKTPNTMIPEAGAVAPPIPGSTIPWEFTRTRAAFPG